MMPPIQKLQEIIVWSAAAGREAVLIAIHEGSEPDAIGGIGLWQSFQQSFPKEAIGAEWYDLAVAIYSQTYTSTVVEGIKLLTDKGPS